MFLKQLVEMAGNVYTCGRLKVCVDLFLGGHKLWSLCQLSEIMYWTCLLHSSCLLSRKVVRPDRSKQSLYGFPRNTYTSERFWTRSNSFSKHFEAHIRGLAHYKYNLTSSIFGVGNIAHEITTPTQVYFATSSFCEQCTLSAISTCFLPRGSYKTG